MKCKNTTYDHECHPHYARKYGGYCLDCSNAGVPELRDELDQARAALRLAVPVLEAIRAVEKELDLRNSYSGDPDSGGTKMLREVLRQLHGWRAALAACEPLVPGEGKP